MGILHQETECESQDIEKFEVETVAEKQYRVNAGQDTETKPYQFEFCVFVLFGASVSIFLDLQIKCTKL